MIWQPPESEEAWQECLSAYLDGEMELDEQRAIEQYLEQDRTRTAQLDTLRYTSRLLQEWQIEVPKPDPPFVQNLRSEFEMRSARSRLSRAGRRFSAPMLRWAVHAAVFLVGVGTGATGLRLVETAAVPPEQQIEIVKTPTVIVKPDVVNVTASPARAEGLLREVIAGNLRGQILEYARSHNWERAVTVYQTLRETYSDTDVFRDLQQNQQMRQLEAFVTSRST